MGEFWSQLRSYDFVDLVRAVVFILPHENVYMHRSGSSYYSTLNKLCHLILLGSKSIAFYIK